MTALQALAVLIMLIQTANIAYEVSTVTLNFNTVSPLCCYGFSRASRQQDGQFRNQDNTRKQGNNKDTSSKAMLAIDGVGFDWSDIAEEQVTDKQGSKAFSDSERYDIGSYAGVVVTKSSRSNVVTHLGLTHKAKKDWVKELCTKNKVNFMGLQETKMEAINLFDVRACWGNANFDCVHSDSVRKSGGILCIWDTSSFSRSSMTKLKKNVCILSIWFMYPNQWKGEIVMMGDFNEVRYKADRFGSNFNAREADIFNSFILNAGIEEIPLGGSMYTWCHRSAKKMSKLDRFFVSCNLIVECPNISAELGKLDESIDKGCGSDEITCKRLETLNKIQQLNSIHASEVAQKAKINWAIEGDENVKFFHGLLNKKRSQNNIRGILSNGVWLEDPEARIKIPLSNSLSHDQKEDLESMVTKEEVKRARNVAVMYFFSNVLVHGGANGVLRIQTCLNSSRGSILINGSPIEEFQFFKGLKQGDHLSPFLFILIMESLHISFQRVIDANLFTGIKLNSLVNLTHLFYADDALFIGQWSDSNIDTLVHVLDCFHRASGLRINMCKSKIMCCSMSGKLGRRDVEAKVLALLSKWKMKTLSIGGRFTLLKAVLGSMPIFHMSIYKVPINVLKSLESFVSFFQWD
ncbi:RNA-directed DNA polymerase, eukaryota [Tanacetum coccineum]